MKITPLFALFILLTTGCATNKVPVKTTKEKKAELYYVHGSQALVIRDYTTALSNLLKSVEYVHDDTKAHNNLGMAYFFKGNLEKAKHHLEMAIKIDKKNSDARNNLGSLYLHQKKYRLAKKQYEMVLKDLTYSLQHRVYYNLALIDLAYNRKDLAMKNLLKSVNENDSYCPAYYQLGVLTTRKRNYHSALEYFKKASRGTCVSDPEPHYQEALTLVNLGEDQRALFKFKEIISSFPDSKQAIWSKRKLKSIDIARMRKERQQKQQMTRTPVRERKKEEPRRKEVESIKF